MNKIVRLCLALALLLALSAPAYAADTRVDTAAAGAAGYLTKTVAAPATGSVGGEWAVIGLARGGFDVPEGYFEGYYQRLEQLVAEKQGVLHDRKYTEYSRVVLALTAIGQDPTDVAGYNLLLPLADYDKTVWQGINGPIWALLALDAGDYELPQNPEAKTQASREAYVAAILAAQRSDGGWALSPQAAASDADVTAMAMQALANYQEQPEVKAALERALGWLSGNQAADGGFSSYGTANSESVVQGIVALTSLGIDINDSRFVKDGHSLLDALLSYQQGGQGFAHSGSGSDLMASEQGLYALVALQRAEAGRPSLYDMSDVTKAEKPAQGAQEPAQPTQTVTFTDLAGVDAAAKTAIETLSARGVITGEQLADGSWQFRPAGSMTRAEFCAIVVRALPQVEPERGGKFNDVKAGAWYAPYVNTANKAGIVNGTTDTSFAPENTITRQEAVAMVTRAAKLGGMGSELTEAEIGELLANLSDGEAIADYAREPYAFCYRQGILPEGETAAQPAKVITRGEIALMLCNMLAGTPAPLAE